jgi:hypothetical protein
MLKPIKRIFIPKHLALQPMAPAEQATPPAPGKPNALFDELPQPDMEEKNSDSIWAAFDSVQPLDLDRE